MKTQSKYAQETLNISLVILIYSFQCNDLQNLSGETRISHEMHKILLCWDEVEVTSTEILQLAVGQIAGEPRKEPKTFNSNRFLGAYSVTYFPS